MQIDFYKYQGTGNDFIFIDNRNLKFPKNNIELVAKLCHRKFGIGADGLILLESNPSLHFSMVYYNADGNLSTMCGNGGRCIVHFAQYLGIISSKATFEAVDGKHSATIDANQVSLKMNDVFTVEIGEKFAFLDTGSPHHVALVDNLSMYDVVSEGRKIRNQLYGTVGANVNFVEERAANSFAVRTYERGVEDETLSCGTGVTAVAIAMDAQGRSTAESIQLLTPGGVLEVSFQKTKKGYEQIYLKGPATQVFKGHWNL